MNPRPRTVESLDRAELARWRNALFVIFALSGVTLSSWVARLPSVRDDLTLSTFEIGLIMLAASIGSILGLVAAPPLLARFGARSAIVLMYVAGAAGLAAMGLGTSLFGLVTVVVAGLAVFGFTAGAADVMINVDAATAEKALRRTIMPLMHGCFSLGTIIGAAIGAAAAALRVPVALHLAAIALFVAAAALTAVRFVPVRVPDGTAVTTTGTILLPTGAAIGWRERVRARVAVWRDGRLLLIGLVMLGMAFAEGGANDWIALATVDGHHQSNAAGAVFLGIFVTAMTIGRFAGGPFIDRFGRVAAVRVTAVLGVVGLLAFILADTPWLAGAGTVLWGLGASLGFPLGMSAAAEDGRHAAARVSAVAMIGYCALLVGPPLLGFLGEHLGILHALYLIFLLIVIAGVCAPAVRGADRARRGMAPGAEPGTAAQ